MTDVVSVAYVMQGARDAIAAGLPHIDQQVTAIEAAVNNNPGLAFDLSKTLVESACKAVLAERAIEFASDDDLPKLFKLVTLQLPFLPVAASSAAAARVSLERTLNGLHTAVQGICELRNQCGFASHGSESQRPQLETVQALLAAQAADAIVGFLYRVHRQDRTLPPPARAEYETNDDFNGQVDELHDVIHIFESEFMPSEVLFEMEPQTYRLYLAEFRSAGASADGGEEVPGSGTEVGT